VDATQVLIHRLDDLNAQEVHWLWPGYLPRGKLVLLDGDPGQGKSLLTLDLAARLTSGRPWPDGAAAAPPGNVVLVNCEDGLTDTILPRLRHLGADAQRIFAFQGHTLEERFHRLPVFPRDTPDLRALIEQAQARLVVLDPLMAFLDVACSSISDQSIRQALVPLATLAEETGCTLLVVRHLNKTGQGRALYRGSGSIGIIGSSRCAYLVGRDPEDADTRVLACLKTNLGPQPASLAFQVSHDDSGLKLLWQGPTELAADELLTVGKRTPPLERAKEFLLNQLKGRAVETGQLLEQAGVAGISQRTLERAKAVLGVHTRRQGGNKSARYFWTLAAPGSSEEVSELLNYRWDDGGDEGLRK
jgi:hypothetical protein